MYDLPSHDNVEEVVVNKDVVAKKQTPLLIYTDGNGSPQSKKKSNATSKKAG